MPAFFKPGRLGPIAQPLNARLVGAALVNDAHALDASLSTGSERPRGRDDRRENRDDFPPPHEHLPLKRTLLSVPVEHERMLPHFSFRFLPSPPFFGRFTGLRTGRGARTRLPEGARIVGQTCCIRL